MATVIQYIVVIINRPRAEGNGVKDAALCLHFINYYFPTPPHTHTQRVYYQT
jgi:hypothetical protein